MFNKKAGKVSEFLIACKLFIWMRMRDIAVEKQVKWMLSYIQGELVNIWKENIELCNSRGVFVKLKVRV